MKYKCKKFSYSYSIIVVPHITDSIQEWVERVANQSVSEDGRQPEVYL